MVVFGTLKHGDQNKTIINIYFVLLPIFGILNQIFDFGIETKRIFDITTVFVFFFMLYNILIHRAEIKITEITKLYYKLLASIFMILIINAFYVSWDSWSLYFASYEFKMILYLFTGFLFTLSFNKDQARLIVDILIIWSIVIIMMNLFSRGRIGINDEINYDIVTVFSGILLHNLNKNHIKMDFPNIVFATAIFLSKSKLGIGLYLIYIFYDFYLDRRKSKLFIYTIYAIFSIVWIVETRGSSMGITSEVVHEDKYVSSLNKNIEKATCEKKVMNFYRIDRVKMIISFLKTLRDQYSLMEIMFGKFPGTIISNKCYNIKWFYDEIIKKRGGSGMYPYVFHGQFLRIILTYGIIGLFVFLYFFYKVSLMTLGGYFIVVIFLASFVQGVFYLSVVSIPVQIIMINAYLCRKNHGHYNHQ